MKNSRNEESYDRSQLNIVQNILTVTNICRYLHTYTLNITFFLGSSVKTRGPQVSMQQCGRFGFDLTFWRQGAVIADLRNTPILTKYLSDHFPAGFRVGSVLTRFKNRKN